MKQLLLAIPDNEYRGELHYIFEADGYGIQQARRIREVMDVLAKPVDLILCDMQYPDGTGLTLIEKVREVTAAPLIVVTDVAEDLQKVLALEYGADDVIVKPFNILELKARMRSLLRRGQKQEQDSNFTVTAGALTLNIIGRQVEYAGKVLELTGREFDILLVLASEPEEIFSRYKLAEIVWGGDFVGDIRGVDVHVKRIRRKFYDAGIKEPPLKTKWGEGYYFSRE